MGKFSLSLNSNGKVFFFYFLVHLQSFTQLCFFRLKVKIQSLEPFVAVIHLISKPLLSECEIWWMAEHTVYDLVSKTHHCKQLITND